MIPTIVISNRIDNTKSNCFRTLLINGISISFYPQFEKEYNIFENSDYYLFAHVNHGVRNIISQLVNYNFANKEIEELQKKMQWGFVLVISKVNGSVSFYNDIYGIYPVYFSKKRADFIISNDFDDLAQMQDSLTFNKDGVYDYLLFNYTIKSRTLFSEITQLEGGSKLSCKEGILNIERILDFADLINDSDSNPDVVGMYNSLRDNINREIDINLPIQLPLTGGFDSKVILALLLQNKNDFSTYTFGDPNGADNLVATTIAEEYGITHSYIGLSDDFLNEVESNVEQFIGYHPNAPMLDTLLYYILVRNILPPSNIVTGKMGGELIVGPVLISELIITRGASVLTQSQNENELIERFEKGVKEMEIINNEHFSKHARNYILPLLSYTKENQKSPNINIAIFLLKESYAKFFGSVYCVLFGKHNLINPFVDIEFVNKLLNSKYSFLKKKPFSKEPFSHFLSRRLYPLLVKKASPSVLNTPMDRGYNMKDFLHWYNFPRPFFNYISRHIKVKKPVNNTFTGYLPKIKELVVKNLDVSPILEWEILNKNQIKQQIESMKKGQNNRYQNQKLMQLLTLHYINQRYSNKIKK